MTMQRTILLAAAMLSSAVFLGLIFGDRFQIVRDRDFYAWRLDKLTGGIMKCYAADRTCVSFKDYSN